MFAAADIKLHSLTETLHFANLPRMLRLRFKIILNQSVVDQGLLAKAEFLNLENVNIIMLR